ncbi:MAG: YVTN family beta-propeller repeat protein [Tardiphaga sp.]
MERPRTSGAGGCAGGGAFNSRREVARPSTVIPGRGGTSRREPGISTCSAQNISGFRVRSGCALAPRNDSLIACALALSLWLCAFASPAHAFIAYISNEKSNTVSVIDTDTWTVTKTIKVGQRPRGIAFTRDGKSVLVAVGDDDTIEVIDVAQQQVVGTLPSGPDPELFVQDADGKLLYVANENDNTVTIIDIANRARLGEVQVGVEPEGMAISPDGRTLINTSETTNMAHFIDTTTREIVANVLVDSRPRYAVFKRDSSELWVSAEIGGTVTIIDPAKREAIGKINFAIPGLRREAIQPVGIGMTKDGKTAFVALGPANRVAVVDAVSRQVTKYLLVGQRVWHLAFTPDEKYLLTSNGVSNDVSVIDVAAQKVIKTIQVGELPWGIAMAPP